MTKTPEDNDSPNPYQHAVKQVRLPGFITDKEIGLGDVIKSTTSYMGIKPCGGCEKRAATLNRWLVFTTRQQK